MNDRELIQALDACRAASDDLRQPEMRAAAERVASDPRAEQIRIRLVRLDAAMMQAMHQTPSPADFESRLLARLNSACEPTIGDRAYNDVPAPALVSPSRRSGALHSRRQLLAWSAGLAATAAAIFAAVLFLQQGKPLTIIDLEAGGLWHEQLSQIDQWQMLAAGDLARRSLPNELRQTPLRFRDATDIIGHEAQAYDLTVPGGPIATLFVIEPMEDGRLPSMAPVQPQMTTMGYSIAYWQRGGALFVVVLQSDRPEDYRRLLRTGAPLA